MMERNHRNTFGRNMVSSMPENEPAVDQVTENDSCLVNHGFPRKLTPNENMNYDSSEDFTLRIITRMPNLTGYGHNSAPQGISLYRTEPGQKHNNLDILQKLRKLSFLKWCAILPIVAVVAMILWGLFPGADAQKISRDSISDDSETKNITSGKTVTWEPLRSTSSRGVSEFQFDEYNSGASSAGKTGNQGSF